jgi:hypothetical protein
MPSLPTLGQKPWKQALEDWLLTAHNTDGTRKSVTFRVGHTWALSGALAAGFNVPQIFVPVVSGQVPTLVGARAMIGSGTSIVCQVQRNGTNLGSAITVTTTAATTAFSQALADADTLDLVLSSPTGSPVDLSFTLIVEHVV